MSVGVAVLGSTGSIGRSTLQVLARQRDRFRVVAITGHSNSDLLAEQAKEWKPALVGLVNDGRGEKGEVRDGARRGTECLVEAATHPDVRIVVNGIVGAAGLEATLAALKAGKRVALANKETLVMAGELVAQAAREGGGEIVPVDSEHSAVLQCVAGRRPTELARPVPHLGSRARVACQRGRGAQASDVDDGQEDHGRLGDARQQGARSDRSSLFV